MPLPERCAATQALLPGMALTVLLAWGGVVGEVCITRVPTLGGVSCH